MWEYLSTIICNSTPVESFESSDQIEVFPNPFTDVINIKSGMEIKMIQLYNSIGQVVFQESNTNQILVKSLPNGVYWLSITDRDDQRVVKSIVKN